MYSAIYGLKYDKFKDLFLNFHFSNLKKYVFEANSSENSEIFQSDKNKKTILTLFENKQEILLWSLFFFKDSVYQTNTNYTLKRQFDTKMNPFFDQLKLVYNFEKNRYDPFLASTKVYFNRILRLVFVSN